MYCRQGDGLIYDLQDFVTTNPDRSGREARRKPRILIDFECWMLNEREDGFGAMRFFSRLRFGRILAVLVCLGLPVPATIGCLYEYLGPERRKASVYEYLGLFVIFLVWYALAICACFIKNRRLLNIGQKAARILVISIVGTFLTGIVLELLYGDSFFVDIRVFIQGVLWPAFYYWMIKRRIRSLEPKREVVSEAEEQEPGSKNYYVAMWNLFGDVTGKNKLG